MDYKKLSEASLDEIMKQIRMISNVPQPEASAAARQETAAVSCAAGSLDSQGLELDASLSMVDQYLANAVVGKEIGLKKAPMYKKKGLKRKVARVIEKIYLRIAELSNRDIREFNGLILSSLYVVKDRIKALFQNDRVLLEKVNRLSEENAALRQQVGQIKEQLVNELNEELRAQRSELTEENAALRAQLTEENAALRAQLAQIRQELLKEQNGDLAEKVQTLQDAWETQLKERTAALVEQMHRQRLEIRHLEEKMDSSAAVVRWANRVQCVPEQGKNEETCNALADPLFYHDFEERFRGEQFDIRQRLEVYLPMLQQHFGSLADKRFVDIGCGRGEWLDVISANGATDYIGVDINPVQLEICAQKGHPTKQCDCLQYLSGLPDESVDLITGIQIIEHMPLEALLALFAESRRVLRPNGMILFETPNPFNLITASTWFYADPTHVRPVNQQVARFLAERSGYRQVSVLEVNPASHAKSLLKPICFDGNQAVWDENVDILNGLFFGPQDYAIVGVK